MTTTAPRRHRKDPLAWLAEAHFHSDHAAAILRRYGRAALFTGITWNVIQVPEETGLAARGTVNGPAWLDPYRRAVFYLAPLTACWRAPGTAYLSGGTMVCVPAPDVCAPPPDIAARAGVYWLTPPDGTGRLVDHEALLAVAETARRDGPALWCEICGWPAPSVVVHEHSPDGPGYDALVHRACAPAES
ncbi:hypothetical protein [Streptomyces sp. enrichment culture]|uniref:hypothetical protein n=1 Tax=Streptomyces sp. enrichment culture TaxID=1795815 RepID=UPI003F554CE6